DPVDTHLSTVFEGPQTGEDASSAATHIKVRRGADRVRPPDRLRASNDGASPSLARFLGTGGSVRKLRAPSAEDRRDPKIGTRAAPVERRAPRTCCPDLALGVGISHVC